MDDDSPLLPWSTDGGVGKTCASSDSEDSVSSSDSPRASGIIGLGSVLSLFAGGGDGDVGVVKKRKRDVAERPAGGPAPVRKKDRPQGVQEEPMVVMSAEEKAAAKAARARAIEMMTVEEKAAAKAARDKAIFIDPNAVFLLGIPWAFSETALSALIASYGTIVEARIARNVEGRSRGFGFVRFADAESAQAVLDAAAATPIVVSSRTLTVGPCRHDLIASYKAAPPTGGEEMPSAVFVKHLPHTIITSDDLSAFLTPFGAIQEARVACDGNGKGRGFGFVVFSNQASANASLGAVVVAEGRVLAIEPCRSDILKKFHTAPSKPPPPPPPPRVFGSVASLKPRTVRRK